MLKSLGSNFDIQSLDNGIPLPKYSLDFPNGVHASHPEYNTYVRSRLTEIDDMGLDMGGQLDAISKLRQELVDHMEKIMNNAGSGTDNRLNEYFRKLNQAQAD